MISVEIRVNGSLISAVNAVNRGPLDSRGRCRYEYKGFAFPYDLSGATRSVHGFVEHVRSDGAEALVAQLCQKIIDR